jgi:acyl-CoA dehydrogenase
MHLLAIGSRLKRMEATEGRFADVLSWLLIISSVLRRFEADGARDEDAPLMRWCAEYGFARIQEALESLHRNNQLPLLSGFYRTFGQAYCRLNSIGSEPSDSLSFLIAKRVQIPGTLRDTRLTGGIFEPDSEGDPFTRLERAFRLAIAAQAAPEDPELRRRADEARVEAVQVDDFSFDEYLGSGRKKSRAA